MSLLIGNGLCPEKWGRSLRDNQFLKKFSKQRQLSRRVFRCLSLEHLEAKLPMAVGAAIVKDIAPGAIGSNVANDSFSGSYTRNYLAFGNSFFFARNDGVHGYELWKTDGTEAGTVMVRDISPGPGDSTPSYFTEVNGILYFLAKNTTWPVFDWELWRSDGTSSGTYRVKDIGPGNFPSNPRGLTNVNGTLFFSANDGTHGTELWKSDGSAAGTVMVKNINTRTFPTYLTSSNPNHLTNVNGTLFFSAGDGTNGAELWKSNGTEAGTVMVKDISPGSGNSSPQFLTNVNGTLFFRADDGTNGPALWKSEGTDASTLMLRGVNSGLGCIADLFNGNGTLYFRACDAEHGYELWKSDGTQAGTVLVKDLLPGVGGSNPRNFTVVNETLFFTANFTSSSNSIWKSNGTHAGTELVSQLPSYPSWLTNASGTLYFRGSTATSGIELWKSDGTSSGTRQVRDIRPNNGSSYPGALTNVNGTLFFVANDGTHGEELWKTTPNNAPTDIGLSSSTVAENSQPNTSVGTFSTSDPDSGDAFTYTLVPGIGDTDNAAFNVLGATLRANSTFDYETQSIYSIRVRSTDQHGSFFEKAFDVSVIDINEAPLLTSSQSTISGSVFSALTNSGTWSDPEGGSVALAASMGTVTKQPDGNWFWSFVPSQAYSNQLVSITASDGSNVSQVSFSIDAIVASVTGRVYYKGSNFAGISVDAALDTSKVMAKPSTLAQTLTLDHLTNNSLGLNGLVFDVDNLPGSFWTASDFEFRWSPQGAFQELNHPPSTWQSATQPSSIVVLPGAVDRVIIEWPDQAIANRWLRITILANANTGLAVPEDFYIGHLAGETTGPTNGIYSVSFADITPIRAGVGQNVNAGSSLDIDKNGTITFADISAMRGQVGTQLTNITLPAVSGNELMNSAGGQRVSSTKALRNDRRSLDSQVAVFDLSPVPTRPSETNVELRPDNHQILTDHPEPLLELSNFESSENLNQLLDTIASSHRARLENRSVQNEKAVYSEIDEFFSEIAFREKQ